MLRIGFIGAGLIATYHSKSIRGSGVAVERGGVYDPDEERATAFAAASGHTVASSPEAVLDDSDAVYICTWTSEHPRFVEMAAARGKAIFCEKPLATNLATAEAMQRTVEAAGITNQVGLVLRRSPSYWWAHHLVTDPKAGRLMSAVFRDDQFIPIQGHYSLTWRGDITKAGAGTLLEHSIHDIDMLRFLGGEVRSVSARSSHFHEIAGIEDVMAVSVGFANGASGTLTSIWHDNLARPSLRRLELFCERRFITITGDDWFGPVEWSDADGASGSLEGAALAEAADHLHDGPANPDGAFLRAVEAGLPAWPDFATAVAARRVADAIYRSAAADGASVKLTG